jgi:hypothetical protein
MFETVIEKFVIGIEQLQDTYDLILDIDSKEIRRKHVNPLNRFGKKCFSQSHEDGITLEILRRLKLKQGTYAEFGVGNGTENNTLILTAMGWKGFWVGGEDIRIDVNHVEKKKFRFIEKWITRENIVSLACEGLASIEAENLDVVSLDLDGNDIYLVEKLLKNNIKPKLFIVEYNGKFPPPIEFKIEYDPQHQWNGDDYFGASLSSYIKLFSEFEYKLICCNSHTGANAFFIHTSCTESFMDVPENINDIYIEPRYYLYKNYSDNFQ